MNHVAPSRRVSRTAVHPLVVVLSTLVLLLSLAPLWTTATFAAENDLDPTFGNPNVNDVVKALAVQPDGKIVIGGQFTSVGGQSRNNVARLNSDGSLDTSFADPNVSGPVFTVALQPDGNIVIGGQFLNIGGQP